MSLLKLAITLAKENLEVKRREADRVMHLSEANASDVEEVDEEADAVKRGYESEADFHRGFATGLQAGINALNDLLGEVE